MKIKSKIATIITLSLAMFSTTNILATPKYISGQTLMLEDKLLYNDKFLTIDGYNYLPARKMFELIGFDTQKMIWNNDLKSFTVVDSAESTLTVQANSKKYIIDGLEFFADVTPIIYDNTLYLPIRYFADIFDFDISYDVPTKTTTFTKGKINEETSTELSRIIQKLVTYNDWTLTQHLTPISLNALMNVDDFFNYTLVNNGVVYSKSSSVLISVEEQTTALTNAELAPLIASKFPSDEFKNTAPFKKANPNKNYYTGQIQFTELPQFVFFISYNVNTNSSKEHVVDYAILAVDTKNVGYVQDLQQYKLAVDEFLD